MPPGTRLGPYEVLSLLGAGGMGEVYRAKDSTLKREAEVLASLNHPHIAQIYGLEHAGDTFALVMELVEGEDLAQRIARGRIPLDEALPIARQIAEALEAAHEHGIIHRDLKPANVKVRPDGTVKVLDFGLAKAVPQAPSPKSQADENLANSPTLSIHATQAGIVLGTAAYMSPEQARGKAVDRRADIWAFGAVLFEMLTAKRAFHGDDATDTIVAVMSKNPDWNALPASTPIRIRTLLRRCLEKDQKRRLDSAAGLRIEIDDAVNIADPPEALKSRGRQLPWAVAALALVIAVAAMAFAITSRLRPEATPQPVHLLLSEHASVTGSGGDRSFAISPDGRRTVFLGNSTGTPQLYLRDLGSVTATPIPGTQSASSPFFSPDGQRIGFFTQGKLFVLTLSGGRREAVTDVIVPRGGSWSDDDTIIYSPATDAGLWSVPATGGTPQLIAQPDPAKGERSYRWPEVLPGGDAVLFTVATSDILSFDEARLVVRSLRTGAQHDGGRGA